MSIAQTQRELNQLDNAIAALEKERARLEAKEASLTQKISTVQRGITKNTSPSMLSSENKRIQGYQSEIAKVSRDKANCAKKIADKRKIRANKAVKLQKEETAERKVQQEIQRGYEHRINELNSQALQQSLAPQPVSVSEAGIDTEEYDVFVSHAWEDKEGFVDEFVHELKQLGIKVWYDTLSIEWGDSMRAKIDVGLGKSKFGVIVISPDYIANGKYWPKTELDALFQLESVNGKTILPIWHNITKKEVLEYSPIIAGKLAMNTASMTPKEIADELVNILDKATKERNRSEKSC